MKQDLAIKLLEEVKSLIRQGWCKGDFAKTTSGIKADPNSICAERWCLVGAIDRVISEHRKQNLSVVEAFQLDRGITRLIYCTIPTRYQLSPLSPMRGLIYFNDGRFRTRRGVCRVIDKAIRRVKNQGAEW